MSAAHCARIDDAASYVLRATSDDERQAYEQHLAGCAACSEKVAELSFVGDALLRAVPQMNAPPEIRGRVMAVVRAEAELLQAAGPQADRPERARPAGRRRWLPSLRPLELAALASAALAVGVGGGALLGGDGATRTVAAKVATPGAKAQVRLSPDGATLVVAGMKAPPENRVYQVWLRRGAGRTPEPTNALFSVSRDGRASVDVPGDLEGVDAVLVTDEPVGGSKLPTRAPVITAALA
jgi:anti-sigma factor RsiW